jgi:MFS family permease
MRAVRATSSFYYGWLIVGVSAVANMLAWSVRSTFALFYVALIQEFRWPRGEAALGYSLSWLFLIVFGPLAGRAYDRFGARTVVAIGGLLLGAALAATAHVQTVWQYCLTFGVLGAAGIAAVMMPAAAVIPHWFVRTRGTAMGIISAGSSMSAVVFYPLNAWLIDRLGWRSALEVYGLIIVLVIVPAATLFYRRAPGEVSDALDGATRPPPETPSSPSTDAAHDAEAWTLRRALRTRAFWAVFAMWGLGVIGYQIMTTHQVAHALDRGLSASTAAWAFGLSGLFTTAGNLVGGALSDHRSREWVFIVGSAIAVVGIGCFTALDGPEDVMLLFVYVACGAGFGMRISQLTTIPADLFHGPAFGAILGLANGGGGLGGLIGPFVGGYLFDVTGDYRASFALSALAIVGATVAAWIAAPRKAAAFRGAPSPRSRH